MDNVKQQILTYYIRHLQSACNSLGQLSRTPLASLITCLVIGMTLALPTVLYITLKNIEAMRGNLQQTTQVTLYLNNSVTEFNARHLANQLQQKAIINKASVISPEAGLRELQQNAGFQGVLEELTDNPLPWAIILDPNIKNENAKSLDQFIQALKKLPEVDSVQADMLWVKRMSAFIAFAKRSLLALSVLLGAAVLLIVDNAIRSATLRNQKEIEVIKLIGGTQAFIRRPFLYAGIFYGLLGSLVTIFLVMILMTLIQNPADHFAALYHSSYLMLGLGTQATLVLIASGIFLGLIGAHLAVKAPLKY